MSNGHCSTCDEEKDCAYPFKPTDCASKRKFTPKPKPSPEGMTTIHHGVRKFSYNGFSGKLYDEIADYTAEFIRWTSDPGITVCKCSDGEERNIPTFALIDFNLADHPEQEKAGVMFGVSSHS